MGFTVVLKRNGLSCLSDKNRSQHAAVLSLLHVLRDPPFWANETRSRKFALKINAGRSTSIVCYGICASYRNVGGLTRLVFTANYR